MEINLSVLLLTLFQLAFLFYVLRKNILRFGNIQIFDPFSLLLIIYTIGFSIVPIFIITSNSPDLIIPGSIGLLDLIPRAQLLEITSMIFAYLGYLHKKKSVHININYDKYKWDSDKLDVVINIFIIIYFISIYDRIETNTFFFTVENIQNVTNKSIFTSALSFLGFRGSTFYLVGPLPILAIALSQLNSRKYKFLFYSISSINILIGLYSGQKEIISATIFVYIFYLYYCNNNLTIFTEIKMIFSFLIFLIISILSNLYREFFNLYGYFPSYFDLLLNIQFEDFNYILQRIDYLNVSIKVISQTPSVVPYYLGQTYIEALDSIKIFLPFIDRSSESAFNNTFGRVYGLIYIDDYSTGITVPQFIELFINFGYFLTMPLMYFFGYFLKYISFFLKSNNLNYKLVGFFLLYVWVNQSVALSFSSLFIIQLRLIIPLSLILFLLNNKKNKYNNSIQP